jgi:excinuclease ABC subunit C
MDVIKPKIDLANQIASLPHAPGVYIFKDELGTTVYIGKANSLKSRVRSYFSQNAWRERPKLAVMMPKVINLETIITNSEKEALILESTLIRKHMPRYNVTLKDGKRYPWLAITYDESFPRLIMVRDPARYRKDNPKAKLFGPYVEAGAMWQTVKTLRKAFPMRQRKTPLFKNRPCMNYYIGLCLGPCQNLVEESFYNKMVSQVELFLSGRQNEAIQEMNKSMEEASQLMNFEDAAKLRDRIYALKSVVEKQQVFFADAKISSDIIAFASNDKTIIICLMRIREGKLVDSELFDLPLVEKTTPYEAFNSFVCQYYLQCLDIVLPREILLSSNFEDAKILQDVLEQRAHHNIKVSIPQKGDKLKLIEMCMKNAQSALENLSQELIATNEKAQESLDSLQKELQLKQLPKRIECFDISNIQGTDNVASMVVFEYGKSKKTDYRHFKIRSVEGKPDDFKSMYEVINRRYERLKKEGKNLPDLIVIDGGKGQLSAALSALQDIDLKDIDIIGLAKKQEEIYLPHKARPILLNRRSQALHLLQQIRNEAHRFAITYHRKLRAKRALSSKLDTLPNVSVKRRKILLDHFGSYDNLKEATLDEIKSVPGLPTKIATKIYEALQII